MFAYGAELMERLFSGAHRAGDGLNYAFEEDPSRSILRTSGAASIE
jgi:hypothetical protein